MADDAMSEDSNAQITRLEMLFAEQEFTLQALDSTVAQQDRELTRMKADITWLKQQFLDLKAELPGEQQAEEKPPHY